MMHPKRGKGSIMAKDKKAKKDTLKKKVPLKKKAVSKKEGATKKATKKAENKGMKKIDSRASAKSKAVTAIAINLADFTCPCCSKRCPLSKPKCGKGKAIAKKKSEKASKAA